MSAAAASSYELSSPMVSQPYAVDQRTLAVRRPPSTSSRSTTTRRHRSHRSHHGGVSYAPQNEFPNFAHSGDVEIIVSIDGQEKHYMLHRLILAQCSGFFEAGTSEEWSQAQAQAQIQSSDESGRRGAQRDLARIGEEDEDSQSSKMTAQGPTVQRHYWRYELDTGNQLEDIPMLIQKV